MLGPARDDLFHRIVDDDGDALVDGSFQAGAAGFGGEAFHRDAVVAKNVGLSARDRVLVRIAIDPERHGEARAKTEAREEAEVVAA